MKGILHKAIYIENLCQDPYLDSASELGIWAFLQDFQIHLNEDSDLSLDI